MVGAARLMPSIEHVLLALASDYGEPSPPPLRSVFELLVLENVAYLVDDAARERAFAALKANVGVQPRQLLAASDEALRSVTGAGILADHQIGKLRRIAQLALEDDPELVRTLPLRDAKRVLMRYPSIGEPGAEKILLCARSHPVLGLESNGVRVLTRLGLVKEEKSYSRTYRNVQAFAAGMSGNLIRVHQLLRQHGQELCRRTNPKCAACPLRDGCGYYARAVR